jgi:outer membrane biosynthesis protein TonB
VILIARSRRPDTASAPPANVEPAIEVPGKSLEQLRQEVPTRPEATKPEATRRQPPPPPAEGPPSVVKISPPPPSRVAAPARNVAAERERERARNRRPHHQVASAETASRNSTPSTASSLPEPTPVLPAPVADSPRSVPAPESPARRPAPVRPPSESAPAVVAERAPPASPPPGFVDSKAVTAVVRAHAAEVQGCFDRALMEHADLHGRLTVRASIDPGGRVLSVTPTAVMQGGGRLQTCVVELFGRWSFPPPAGGVKGTITYSFSFE